MVSGAAERVRIACAKNVAALRLLHKPHHMVSQPFTNPDINRQQQWPGYTLPFDTEKKLASTLAFLASTIHRSDNVTAICIQENRQTSCLNVLVAINKASATSGMGTLDCVKQTFGNIFSLLADTDGQPLDVKRKLFAAIVSMSSRSLSCTLDLARRLCVKTVGPYRPLSHYLLYSLCLDLQSKVKSQTGKDIFHGFLGLSERLAQLIETPGQGERNSQLELLMDDICRLGQISNIRTLLAEIASEPIMNNLAFIMKLADAATLLYSIAREFPLARNMRFVAAELPEKAFAPMPTENCAATLQETIPSKNVWEESKSSLYSNLGISEHDADREISQYLQITLTEAKVHAEVQLVYYCELNASDKLLWPRVVSSSKDPCWLCHSFIHIHGKLHTSNSQGRLYPRWRLPLFSGRLSSIAENFNDRLKEKLFESLKLAIQGNRQAEQPATNEDSPGSVLYNLTTSEGCNEPIPFCSAIEKDPVEQTPATVPLDFKPEVEDSPESDVS